MLEHRNVTELSLRHLGTVSCVLQCFYQAQPCMFLSHCLILQTIAVLVCLLLTDQSMHWSCRDHPAQPVPTDFQVQWPSRADGENKESWQEPESLSHCFPASKFFTHGQRGIFASVCCQTEDLLRVVAVPGNPNPPIWLLMSKPLRLGGISVYLEDNWSDSSQAVLNKPWTCLQEWKGIWEGQHEAFCVHV